MSTPISLRDPRVMAAVTLAAASVLAVVSWQFGYQPAVRSLRAVRERVVTTSEDVSGVEAMVAAAGGEAAWLTRQHARLEVLQHRLPSSREMPRVLDAVLEQVAQSNLRLVNVAQGNPEPALDASGQQLTLNQAQCLRLPVTITVEGRFSGVLECLSRWLDPSFRALVRIDRLQVRLRDPLTGQLTADLQLRLHALAD